MSGCVAIIRAWAYKKEPVYAEVPQRVWWNPKSPRDDYDGLAVRTLRNLEGAGLITVTEKTSADSAEYLAKVTEKGFTITDQQERTLLNAAEKHDLPIIQACASSAVKDDATLLHYRLGHPGSKRQEAATGTHLKPEDDCEICIKAKMTKAPMVPITSA